MLRLGQRDPRWGKVIIGKSNSDLAGNGCLITSLCMVWSKFHYGVDNRDYLRPDEAAKTWKFVAVPGDPDPRYLDWIGTEFQGMEFVSRVRRNVSGFTDADRIQCREFAKMEDYGVVLNVETPSGQHWVTVVGGFPGNLACNDPWDATRRWKTYGWGTKYPRALGYAIMKRK